MEHIPLNYLAMKKNTHTPKNIGKTAFILFISLFIAYTGNALTVKTWTGSTNTNFNTGTNWSPSGVPSASDSCVISVSASRTITLSAPITVGALNMVVSGNNNALVLDVVSHLLTIEGNLHMKAISGNNNTLIRLDCGSSSGGVTIGRNAYIDDAGTRNAWVIADVTSPGVLTFNGNATFGPLAQTSPTIEPNITFDGASTQTVTINNTASFFLAEDLKIGNTNNPSVILTGATPNGFGCYDGVVSVNGTSVLNLGNYTINRMSSGGALTLAAGSTLKIGTTRTFPTNYTTYNLNATSNVYYDGANQIVAANVVYGNLFLEGSGTKTLNATATINGNLSVSEIIFDANASMDIKGNVNLHNATFLGGTATSHTIEGNWSNNEGTYTPETSTISFSGNSRKTIENRSSLNLIYTQDFETTDSWTTETNSGNTWGLIEDATYAYTNNNKFARYRYHASQAADSWLFSKGITMTAGKTYTVKFHQRVRSASFTEKLKITIGTSNNSAAQTTTLLTLPELTNIQYTERIATFVAPSTGTYYFGFHCFSIADRFDLYIDNVRVYEETEPISITESFYNLSVNKSGGATLDLSSVASVSNSLIFTSGIIISTDDYYPEFGVNATVGGSPSASSHVNGPVRKLTNSSTLFTFPVGDGSSYRSIALSPTSTGATTWRAKYNNTQYSSLDVDLSLDHVSSVEYWDLDRIAGTESAAITLSWDVNSGDFTEYTDLVVAHFNGTNWENAGGNSHTGNNTTGTVVSDAAWNTYSPFTIGNTNPGNALPVVMTNFNGSCQTDYVHVFWQTASEMNCSHFDIESSTDGFQWEVLGSIQGNGNSTSIKNYDWLDYTSRLDVRQKPVYYRLRQVDFDGKEDLINPISVFCEEKLETKIELYPNPTNGSTKIFIYHQGTTDETAQLILTDVAGKLISQQTITLLNGGVEVNLDLTNYESGIYYVTFLSSTNERINQRLIKQ
jgi:hypothetical protein